MGQWLRLFFSRENSVRGATGILAVTLLFSNLLGVIRDHFLAQKIPTDVLDIYYTAFRWPDLLFNLIIFGAVSSAFIPIFSATLEKDAKKAIAIANTLLVFLSVVLVVIVIVFALLMPWLVELIAPGFPAEKLSKTVLLARFLLISPLLFSLSYIFSGMLQSWQRFIIPSLSPLVYNLSIITATIFWADRFGVIGVAWGVVIGASFHGLIQLPQLVRIGWRLNSFVKINDQAFLSIFRLMGPRIIGLAANQLLLFVFTSIASAISAGSVAIYNLADNIQTTPTVVFAQSIASALFPTLSKGYAKGENRRFGQYIEKSIIAILFFLIPLSIAVILLRSQIVRIVLGSGYFGWEETIRTSSALGGFALGIPWAGLVPLLAKSFYARHNTLAPTVVAFAGAVLAIGFGYGLANRFDVMGLALASSLGSLLSAVVLYGLLNRQITINNRLIFHQVIKIVLSTFMMSLVVQSSKMITGNLWPLTTALAVLTQIVVSAGLGLVAYLVFISWLKFDLTWLKQD